MPSKSLKAKLLSLLRFGRNSHIGELEFLPGPFNVLLVKQSERLGNVILLNAAIDAISRRFPAAKMELLLPAAFCGLMSDDKRISRIIPVFKRTYIVRPWKLVFLLRDLRKSKYDLAIDCSDVNSHSFTGMLYTILSGSKTTAGWKIGESPIFDIEVPKYSETVHATEMYLRLLSGVFGIEMRGEPYFDSVRESIKNVEPVVGINCGGRGQKRWAMENFVELGERLSASGISSELILGPDEENWRAILREKLPRKATLLPLTPLPELKKRIGRYAVFVSSDTGPMHLAWSLKIPTLAIFVDSELEKFKPLAPGSQAFKAEDISAGIVFENVMKIVSLRRITA